MAGVEQELQAAFAKHRAGRLEDALADYERLLARAPRLPRALHLAGLAAHELGRHALAAERLGRAAELSPGDARLHYHLGDALDAADRPREAIAAYRRAIALAPELAAAHNSLGVAHARQGAFAAAEACYRRALAIDPTRALSLGNLGVALLHLERLDEAVECLERAVALAPGHADGWFHLGDARSRRGEVAAACAAWRRAVALEPGHEAALAALAYHLRHICDWDGLEGYTARLDRLTRQALAQGRRPRETPFASLVRTDDPAQGLAIARAWAREVARKAAAAGRPFPPPRHPDPTKPVLRVGYLTGQLHNHPTLHTLRHLLPCHDRGRVEVTVYAYGRKDDSIYRQEALAAIERLVDIDPLPFAEAAARIHADGIDILVDLTGFTAGTRLEILALRPAPVQVAWLGYAATTGAEPIDYFLTDAVLTPPALQPFFSERLVTLPETFMVLGPEPTPPGVPPGRAAAGLPEGRPVLCSLSAFYKIDPELFASWMRLLEAVPEAVLWLRGDRRSEPNLRRHAAARGVDPARLIFAPKVDYRVNLARLGHADLALDTVRYNGGVTSCNLLWAGVPIVTVRGRHPVSRMSTSLLASLGLDELIADDLGAYEATALSLLRDPARLAGLRARLLARRATAAPFDPARFCRHLERAYRAMWRQFATGAPPRPLTIPAGRGGAPAGGQR
jgi:predicted O-linked N-acetylglucosamine transferase (SPINDLY family)